MKKIELMKKYYESKLKAMQEFKNNLIEIESNLKDFNYCFRNPVKTNIVNKFNEKYKNLQCYAHDNYISIEYVKNFKYFDISDYLLNSSLHYKIIKYKSSGIYTARYKKYDLKFKIEFNGNFSDNNINDIILLLANKIIELKLMLENFNKDLKELNKLNQLINSNIEKFNNYNYLIRTIYVNDETKSPHYPIDYDFRNNILNDNSNVYFMSDLFNDSILLEILEKSIFLKNNLDNILKIEIDNKNKIVKFGFLKEFEINKTYTIEYDLKNHSIIKDDFYDLKYSDFDDLSNLDDETFKKRKLKAIIKIDNLKRKEIISEKIDFKNENVFITTSSLHGFYFPNLKINNYNDYEFVSISFINEICYAVFENEKDEIIIL